MPKQNGKKRMLLIAGMLTAMLLAGCGFFAMGTKALHKYCPGLNIAIDNFNWRQNGGTGIWVLKYSDTYQPKVDTYFTDPSRSFAGSRAGNDWNYEVDDRTIVVKGDSILQKNVTIDRHHVTIAYNASNHSIIIIQKK